MMGRHDINAIVLSPGDAMQIATDLGFSDQFDVQKCSINFLLPADGKVVKVARFFIENARCNPEDYGFIDVDPMAAHDFFERVLDIACGDIENQGGMIIANDTDDRYVEVIFDIVNRAFHEQRNRPVGGS